MKNLLHFSGMRVFAIVIMAVLAGCHEKPVEFNTTEPSIKKRFDKHYRRVTSPLFQSRPLRSSTIMDTISLRDQTMPMRVYHTDTISVTMAIYPKAKVFFYEHDHMEDTLEVYNDSLRFNSLRLAKVDSRSLFYKGSKVEVGKYQYDNIGTHAASHFFSNLFINDSLGLITRVEAGHHGTASAEYRYHYAELHNQIREDSLFYELDYEVGR